MHGMGVSLGTRLVVTDRARRAMDQVCRGQGQQVVVLAWPGAATYLPRAATGHPSTTSLSGISPAVRSTPTCWLSWSGRTRVVLDVVEMPRPGRRPLLQVRAAAQATGRAGTASDSDARIVDELYREFGDSMPGVVIRACLASALADLRGSISQEGLAEMAIRLTRVRLAARRDADLAPSEC